MAIFETFSKRQKGHPDVYSYDSINIKLRNQVFHIWNDFVNQGCFPENLVNSFRKIIYETLLKEEGKKSLYYGSMYTNNDPVYQVEKYFEELSEPDKILDVIEVTFFYIEKLENIFINKYGSHRITYSAANAIKDLNQRFKENGIGYEFTNKQIIRIDNLLLHNEAIKSTLILLSEPEYKNANEEFLKAHEHYRHGRNQESLNESLKAFESTMKIICKMNNWTFNDTDSAKPLINILTTNSFLLKYNESSLSALRQLLEGSVPTVRNKNSGHGQGTEKIIVPNYLANYMLYITGATIRLLVDTQIEKQKKPNP